MGVSPALANERRKYAICGTLFCFSLVVGEPANTFNFSLASRAFAKNGGGQNRSKAEIAQLTAFKYLGNARATGGPGILPET